MRAGWYGVRGAEGSSTTQMPVVWATAHLSQFAQPGWRYLARGSGSGLLYQGGYYSTIVDPLGEGFALHVVKISLDHASCTRPQLPASQGGVSAENITFVLRGDMLMPPGTKLACWRSNFEQEMPILFEQQADITVGPAGTLQLDVAVGDYFTVSTVRTARHGGFVDAPVPKPQPRSPLPVMDDFDDVAISQQPRLWSQMVGAWEVHVDSANASNRVLRQMAETVSVTLWRGKTVTMPTTVVGMREWQDVSIAGRFRLPSQEAGACVATRVDFVVSAGVVLCIGGDGRWNLTYGGDPHATDHVASGRVSSAPAPGVWHAINLTTPGARATGWYDGQPLFVEQPIRDIDSGFAALSTTGYFGGGPDFDDVTVAAVGPGWDPNPAPPRGCNVTASTPAHTLVGHPLSTRQCQSNGITAPDENFYLLPDWRLQHAASGLCAQATVGAPGSVVTLQVCDPSSPLQLWKNDYSNIHHGGVPMVLESANVTLTGSTSGDVRTRPVGWSQPGDWTSWTFFDSTGQLRGQRTPRVASNPTRCLALCRDPPAAP